MNKYVNALFGIGITLSYLVLSSCLMTGKKYGEEVRLDGKTATIILNENNIETTVFIDSLILKENTGDYHLEEVLMYPDLTNTSITGANSLFKRIMKSSKLDSLRKELWKRKK